MSLVPEWVELLIDIHIISASTFLPFDLYLILSLVVYAFTLRTRRAKVGSFGPGLHSSSSFVQAQELRPST